MVFLHIHFRRHFKSNALRVVIICSVGDQAVTFSEVVLEVMRHLEGAYALIFKSRHYPNELIACKRGSPLLLGVKVSIIMTQASYIIDLCSREFIL